MKKPITILWMGGGQDSTAILYLLVFDKAFYKLFVGKGRLLVLMSDTGNEYPETYQHIRHITSFCLEHGVEFYFIEPWMGYHGRAWQSLQHQFSRNSGIMSVAFPKSCTDNLKIKVLYNFLADYLRESYGWLARGKNVFAVYVHHFGYLRSLIGFARGEESRCAEPEHGQKDPRPLWMRQSVRHEYPLVELGYDRADCQRIITDLGQSVPFPSNCMMCPFQNEAEMLFHYRFYPESFRQWADHEAAKIAKHADSLSNLGVKGRKLLPEVLDEAIKKYGHWTDEMLIEYRMSHGHCVRSRI